MDPDLLGAAPRLGPQPLLRQVPRHRHRQRRPDHPRPAQGAGAGGARRPRGVGDAVRALRRRRRRLLQPARRQTRRSGSSSRRGDPSYPIWTGCFWADDELPDDSDRVGQDLEDREAHGAARRRRRRDALQIDERGEVTVERRRRRHRGRAAQHTVGDATASRARSGAARSRSSRRPLSASTAARWR